MLEAEGLGVVEDLVQVLGEGVGVRVAGVVADVAADRVEAVVAGQSLELGEGDGARRALGVSGELDLVVAVLLQFGEDGCEAQRGDLVAQAVELDAEPAGRQDGTAPARAAGRGLGGGAGGAAAAPSSAAAVAPAATPSMFRLLRRWASSGSVCWMRLIAGTPRDRRALSVVSASLVTSQERPASWSRSDFTSVAAIRPSTARGWSR